jgi:hypothetical protein
MSHKSDEHHEIRILERIAEALEAIDMDLQTIAQELAPQPPSKLAVQISQGGFNMPITGINAGGNGTFEADAILNGAADPDGFPAGSVDTWTTDDTLVTLGPDSGPNNSQVVASVDASDKAADFGLTVSVQMPADSTGTLPAPLVMTVRVPIVQAPPPVPNAVAITQVA